MTSHELSSICIVLANEWVYRAIEKSLLFYLTHAANASTNSAQPSYIISFVDNWRIRRRKAYFEYFTSGFHVFIPNTNSIYNVHNIRNEKKKT